MSKFCFKCGATVDSDAEICTNCGAPFGAPALWSKSAPAEEAPQPLPEPEKPEAPNCTPAAEPNPAPAPTMPVKLSKKFLVSVAIIAAAILTLQLVAFGLLGYFTFFATDYTEPIDLYFEVMYAGKSEKVEELAPREYWDKCAQQAGTDRESCVQEAESAAKLAYRSLKNHYGPDMDYSYEIVSETAMTEEALGKVAALLEEKYGIRPESVKQGYTLTITSRIADEDQGKSTITSIQIGYKWYWVIYHESTFGSYAYFPVAGGASIY